MPCVQAFGSVSVVSTSGTKVWKTWMLPPSKLQKALAFLPLCYDADGIFYYALETSRNPDYVTRVEQEEEFDWETYGDDEGHPPALDDRDIGSNFKQGPILRYSHSDPYHLLPQYIALQEVHAEMEAIVPIIKSCNWDPELVKTLHSGVTQSYTLPSTGFQVGLSVYDINGLQYENAQYEVDENHFVGYKEMYDGYIECSPYFGSGNNDYFMLVNRRANIPLNVDPDDDSTPLIYTNTERYGNLIVENLKWDFRTIPDKYIDQYFAVSDPQIVEFEFDGDMSSYALVDAYTLVEWPITYDGTSSSSAEVEIEPGDGMLLSLQTYIPTTLTQSLTLSGQIITHDVTVPSGKTLTLSNNVVLGTDATITVEEGGIMVVAGNNFADSGSRIDVYGYLQAGDGKIVSRNGTWQGIVVHSSNSLPSDFNDFTLKGASYPILLNGGEATLDQVTFRDFNRAITQVNGSSISIEDCEFYIGENDMGLYINNSSSGANSTVFVESETGSQFIAAEEGLGTGIHILDADGSSAVYASIQSANFENLDYGVYISTSETTSHRIDDCSFSGCSTGVYLIGSGHIHNISNCTFTGTYPVPYTDSGIVCNYMKVHDINDCLFHYCLDGIYLNNVSSGGRSITNPDPPVEPDEITDCTFNDNVNCFRLLSSSPRILRCTMSIENDTGMLIADRSLPDCSYTANNVFANQEYNLDFLGVSNDLFTSEINLVNGHNDFYHFNGCKDMRFTEYYDGRSVTMDITCNYWANDQVLIDYENPDDYQPDFINWHFDDDPNVEMIWPPNTRKDFAMEQESEGNLQTALDMYRIILFDRIESEVKEWNLAVDKSYNLTVLLGNDLDELKSFYESLLGDVPGFMTATDYEKFEAVLKDYIKKCEVQLKNYQAAANIVVERLENATTAEDSIYAQMDLETINLIADINGDRAAVVITKYPELKPESMKDYQARVDKHWSDLMALYGIDDEMQGEEQVPAVPVLSMNYPNPFNPTTTICFSIPEASKVEMDIYNIKGQKVKKLVNDDYPRGNHKVQWQGVNETGHQVSSGVYFYRLKVNGKSIGVKKMLMLK